jgi:hypothetical protein
MTELPEATPIKPRECRECGAQYYNPAIYVKTCDVCTGLKKNKKSRKKSAPLTSEWKKGILEDLADPFNDLDEIALCVKYNISKAEYYTWKESTPDFNQKVEELSQKYKDQESIFFRKMLIKRAKTSDRAIQIGLEMTRQYSTKKDQDPFAGMTDDDKVRRIKSLLKRAESKLEGK